MVIKGVRLEQEEEEKDKGEWKEDEEEEEEDDYKGMECEGKKSWWRSPR